MSNKAWEAMKIALHNLNPDEKKIVLTSDGELLGDDVTVCILSSNFEVNDVLKTIGETKLIGIIDSDELNETMITELVNILISESETTVVRVNTNPISCQVLYPIPKVGTKYVYGNYEYTYNQQQDSKGILVNAPVPNGWSVKILDKTHIDYAAPLTAIQGYPVNNMSHLFYGSKVTTLNLIDWDTSNVTNMNGMFVICSAEVINGLRNFDTSNVNNMRGMFDNSEATSLDLSSFDTANVTNMSYMFFGSQAISLNLSSFDTSKVTDMSSMFDSSQATSLDVSSFNTSKVTDMSNMFFATKATRLDVSNFDISTVTTMIDMLSSNNLDFLTAKTKSDVTRYQISSCIPSNTTMIIKP